MINLFLLSTDYKNKKSVAHREANDIISNIYSFLQEPNEPLRDVVKMWQEDFNYIYGDLRTNLSSNSKLKLDDIISDFNIPFSIEVEKSEFSITQNLFFSIQTFFSLLMKSIIKNSLENKELRGDYKDLILGYFAENQGIKNYVNYDWFTWPVLVLDSGFDRILDKIYGHLNSYHYSCDRKDYVNNNNFDFIKQIYESVVPKSFRHSLGEYYTPDWLAERTLLNSVKEIDTNIQDVSIVDPTCGSGTFIFKSIELKRNAGTDLGQIIRTVKGFDINPLAVQTAKTNYILSVLDLLSLDSEFHIPIYYNDVLKLDCPVDSSQSKNEFVNNVLDSKRRDLNIVEELDRVDLVAGNPPWVNWEYMPEEYRKLNQHLWIDYNLFSAKGRDLSFSKEDISVLITYRVIDRFLKDGGILGFVIRQGVFKSSSNGVGFRHFYVKDLFELKVLRVDDLSKIKVFDNASNTTAMFFCKKGERNTYPVPYYFWERRHDLKRFSYNSYSTLKEVESQINIKPQIAVPAIEDDLTSLWLTTEENKLYELKKVLGSNDYQARTGVFTGGANAVYWLDVISRKSDLVKVRNITTRAKRKVEDIQMDIEPKYIFPMLKGSNVRKWRYEYNSYLLCPHSMETKMWPISGEELKQSNPRTYSYLEHFKNNLDSRKGFAGWEKEIQRKEFHAILRVGEYTFSKYKVVWKYIASEFICAVVSEVEDTLLGKKMLLPNEKVMYVSLDNELEAYYLCGVLSSSLIAECVQSYMNPTSISAHVLDKLNIPKFEANNTIHLQIAQACKQGHLDGDIITNTKIIDSLIMELVK